MLAFLLIPGTQDLVTRIFNSEAWLAISALMLASLFIPYQFLMEHPANLGEPWMTLLVYFVLFLFPTVPMVAALLIYQGYKRRGKRLSLAFFLAAGLLLAKVTFNIYWLIVWDNTGNSLDFLWLISPLLGAVFAGLMLFVMLNGRAAWAGISYLVLIPALFFGAYRMAEQVDIHDLTQQRAARVDHAIQAYYLEEGKYPEDLRRLAPRYIFSVPSPLIMVNQEWCYDVTQNGYRLGYVYREHWSNPDLTGRLYNSQGETPTAPLCTHEIQTLTSSNPQYWSTGE